MRRSRKNDRDQTVPENLSLFDIEDELLILRGTFCVLRMIGSSPDGVESEGVAVLARFGEEAFERLYEKWRQSWEAKRRSSIEKSS